MKEPRQSLTGSPIDHAVRVMKETEEAIAEKFQSLVIQANGYREQWEAAERELGKLRTDHERAKAARAVLTGETPGGNGQDSTPVHEPPTADVVSLEAGDEWVIEVEEVPEEPHTAPVEEPHSEEEPQPPPEAA